MIKTIAVLASAAFLLSACVGRGDSPAETAGAVNVVSSSSVDGAVSIDPAGIEALEAGIRGYVDDGHVIGIETKLIVRGETVSHVQHGFRDIESADPIQDDTIYRIYSMTKPVTGVAMMILYEEGAFSLDDPVTKYVPEFQDLKVLAGVDRSGQPILENLDRAPTMRELMSHTAGFAYGLGGDDPANTAFREQDILSSPDLETFIEKTANVPLLFQPGSRWAYSASVDVQGYIVQKLSGQRFGEFLDERIFTPLGMEDTGFFVPAEDLGRLSDVIARNPETGRLAPYYDWRVAFREETVRMESGGGGLVSTMADYERFARMLANGGELEGARVLQPESVELMRTNVLPRSMGVFSDGVSRNPNLRGHGFGLNVGVIFDPSRTNSPIGRGAYYWGGAAGTWFWIDPEHDVIFIGMIQRFGGVRGVSFRGESIGLVYDALETK